MDTALTVSKEVSLNTAASSAARFSTNSATAVSTMAASSTSPLKLTLSSYWRPETSVRLTNANPSTSIHSKYELLHPSTCRTLGHGASSTVRLAYRKSDGAPVAVKVIAKHDALGLWIKTNICRTIVRQSMTSPTDAAGEMRQHVRRPVPRLDEADVLTSLQGTEGIVQLLDVYETCEEVQLVLEYCDGGDLFDCIKMKGSFSEMETATVAQTILRVLDTLHSRNIVHRDIKPENILLESEDGDHHLLSVKLTDFGLARVLQNDQDSKASSQDSLEDSSSARRSRAYSRVGSDYYAAPEVHKGSGYDTPVDIYSLGITLYVMLCGTPPSSTSSFFSHEDFSDEEASTSSVSESSVYHSQLFPSELKISSSAQDLIIKMIHPDPSKRILARDALNHEWVVQHEEETRKVTPRAPKLSLQPSCDSFTSVTKGNLSFGENKTFLRIGPVPPVKPLNTSPVLKITVPQVRKPPVMKDTGLTLADVCSKLAPLVEERFLSKQRKHQRLSHSFSRKRSHNSSSSRSSSPSKKCKNTRFSNSPQVCRLARRYCV